MSLAIVMVVTFVALWALIAWARRPHTVVRFKDGAAELVRGDPPPGLVDDLTEVARKAKLEEGQVALVGDGDGLKIRLEGLPSKHAQRIRNVVQLYRKQIRAKA